MDVMDVIELALQNAWIERARLASRLIVKKHWQAVYDLGAGMCHLRRFVPRGTAYRPFDINPYDDSVKKIDFNERFPKIDNCDYYYRIAVCLGLIEYLDEPRYFFDFLRRNFSAAIISYFPKSDQYGFFYRSNLKNHMTADGVSEALRDAKFKVEVVPLVHRKIDFGGQILYNIIRRW